MSDDDLTVALAKAIEDDEVLRYQLASMSPGSGTFAEMLKNAATKDQVFSTILADHEMMAEFINEIKKVAADLPCRSAVRMDRERLVGGRILGQQRQLDRLRQQ